MPGVAQPAAVLLQNPLQPYVPGGARGQSRSRPAVVQLKGSSVPEKISDCDASAAVGSL